MTMLHIDIESGSTCDLKRAGVHQYAQHPDTRIWCAAYAFDDGPVLLWKPDFEPIPERIWDHVEAGLPVWAHNAAFERTMLNAKTMLPNLTIEQTHCTLALCYNMALPGALEHAAAALGLTVRKDMSGRRVMMQLAKPNAKGVWRTPATDPEKFEILYDYCKRDVEVERELTNRVAQLSAQERRVYTLDQEINDRGIRVDTVAVEAIQQLAIQETKRLDAAMVELTAGQVTKLSDLSGLMEFIEIEGHPVTHLDKADLFALLDKPDLSPRARAALELRREGAKVSTRKLPAMIDRASDDDGRARGCLQYGGAAATMRWSGRAIQVQNLPRPTMGAELINVILERAPELELEEVRTLYGEPMSVFSDLLRGCLIAGEGSVLCGIDFASIEARVLAWLAGEEGKLKLLTDPETDVYEETARIMLGIARGAEVTKSERQKGKVGELAFGYQGGRGAVGTFCRQFFIPYPGEKVALQWRDAWRRAHPRIERYWNDVNGAAIAAVLSPGSAHTAGPAGRHVTFRMRGSFLFCKLPSGQVLRYPYPEVKAGKWGQDELSYMKSGQGWWVRNKYYGGLGAENVTQACARGLLAEAMLRMDAAGYKIVMHVHDEIVTEGRFTLEDVSRMEKLMAWVPSWAKGLPIAVSSFMGRRYRK